MLLGRPTLRQLQIAMDWHVDYTGVGIPRLRTRKKRRDPTPRTTELNDQTQNSNDMDLSVENTVGGFSRKPLVPTSKSAENIFMAERKVKEFMQRVKNRPFKRKVMGIEQIQISRHLPSTVTEGLDGLHRFE